MLSESYLYTEEMIREAFDHLRHRERLARTRRPEERQVALPRGQPLDETLDRGRLVAGRPELAVDPEIRHAPIVGAAPTGGRPR